MQETRTKVFEAGGDRYRITAEFGIDYEFARRNNQAPHFSLTAHIDRKSGNKWRCAAAGILHDEIVEHFPRLKPYVKWHLVSTDGPLHYLANAKFWWEKATGRSKWGVEPYENPPEAFKSTIIWGAIPEDNDLDFTLMMGADDWSKVEERLTIRLPKLMAEFHHVMQAGGLLEKQEAAATT